MGVGYCEVGLDVAFTHQTVVDITQAGDERALAAMLKPMAKSDANVLVTCQVSSGHSIIGN